MQSVPAGCRGGAGVPRHGGGDRGCGLGGGDGRGAARTRSGSLALLLRARLEAALTETTRPDPPTDAVRLSHPTGSCATGISRAGDRTRRRTRPSSAPTTHPKRGRAACRKHRPDPPTNAARLSQPPTQARPGPALRKPPDRTRPTEPTQLSRPTTPSNRNHPRRQPARRGPVLPETAESRICRPRPSSSAGLTSRDPAAASATAAGSRAQPSGRAALPPPACAPLIDTGRHRGDRERAGGGRERTRPPSVPRAVANPASRAPARRTSRTRSGHLQRGARAADVTHPTKAPLISAGASAGTFRRQRGTAAAAPASRHSHRLSRPGLSNPHRPSRGEHSGNTFTTEPETAERPRPSGKDVHNRPRAAPTRRPPRRRHVAADPPVTRPKSFFTH